MNNTLKRTLRTFIQSAAGYIITAIGGGLAGYYDAEGHIDTVAIGGLIVSAIAAGIAALMNLPEYTPATTDREEETEYVECTARMKQTDGEITEKEEG